MRGKSQPVACQRRRNPDSSQSRIKAVRVEDQGRQPSLSDEDLQRHPALREAVERADREYEDASSRHPPECYRLYLTPRPLIVDEGEARSLVELLGCLPLSTGVYKGGIKCNGNVYELRIDLHLCG